MTAARQQSSEPGPTVRTDAPDWTLSAGFTAAVVVAIVFAAVGLLLSRVDLALLALPLIAAAAWAWDRRPDRAQSSTLTVGVTARPGDTELRFELSVAPPDGVEVVALRLASFEGRPQDILVSAGSARELAGHLPLLHSGPQEVLRAEYRLIGADAALVSRPLGPVDVTRVVPPPYAAISSLPLPRTLHGVTGMHDSTRPGDGGEFRDVHPFTAGDRLRRIDWKATARRGRFAGDLYVRRTTATADASVLVVLDSRDDVGEQVREWSRNTAATKGIGSLDVAREAASSIAAGYIRTGDRVGFQDLASQSRMIAHGSGSRHLWRLLRAIELTEPSGVRTRRRRPPVVTAGALVYVLSSFLDDQATRMAELWHSSGHRVIAVDVLPAARFAGTSRYERIAHRIVMMERSDRIRALEAQGVQILRWQEDGTSVSREVRLRQLSRPMRGRR